MITDAQKKYLKIIFQLGGDIELVSNKMLSKKLGAAPPSISQMLDRLTEAGFVKSEHYRGVMLTKKGLTYTIEMTNNHEIIKAFFIKVLNINSSADLPPANVTISSNSSCLVIIYFSSLSTVIV